MIKENFNNKIRKNIRDLIADGQKLLTKNGNSRGTEESVLLLSYLLGRKKYDLYLNALLPVHAKIVEKYYQWIEKRSQGFPIQYITGFQNFMGLEFRVKEGVFIPRPETEILVEKIIDLIESTTCKNYLSILELGVGSGVIPVSVCNYFKNDNKKIYFYAVDISRKAIKLAKENSEKFHCDENIVFFQGDMFSSLQGFDYFSLFDGIVSNPPYISKDELHALAPEIYLYEPFEALDGGNEGLDFYQKIVKESTKYLKEGGFLALEIGCYQKNAVCQMIYDNPDYRKEIDVYHDYYQNERVIITYKDTESQRKKI